MVSTERTKIEELLVKLPHLQNAMKRDPESYIEEFMMQYRHFQSELRLYKLTPDMKNTKFANLVNFLGHVSGCYTKHMANFPTLLLNLLEEHCLVMNPEVRMTVLKVVLMIRNKEMVDLIGILPTLVALFKCNDKRLRALSVTHIVNDIRNMNKNKANTKKNDALKNFLAAVIVKKSGPGPKKDRDSDKQDMNDVAAKKALDIIVELYRRQVWTDAKTVNIIASSFETKVTKLMVTGAHFFLGIEQKLLEDEETKKAEQKPPEIKLHLHSKKTAARQRTEKRQKHKYKKFYHNLRTKDDEKQTQPIWPAMELLHNPQQLSEKLLAYVRGSNEHFGIRLLICNFISRLIGCHQLILLGFYSYIQRYLTSHQEHVTQILSYLVQSCHDLIPPEVLQPVVKSIANNFVTERCSSEVMTVGLNAIREVYVRVPLVLEGDEMAPLVEELTDFTKNRDKSITIAARSFINAIREIDPMLLHRNQRGKFYDAKLKPTAYGATVVREGVDGAELLQKAIEEVHPLFHREITVD
jgi:protein SDA1